MTECVGHNSDRMPFIFRTCLSDEPHTRVRNAVINDFNLSPRELGVLVRLLSLPRHWMINLEHLSHSWGVSTRTIQRWLNDLAKHGYYWQIQRRNSDGSYSGDTERYATDDPEIGSIFEQETARQNCRTDTERQICLAVEKFKKSRDKKHNYRTPNLSPGPRANSPQAVKRRHIKETLSKNKEMKGRAPSKDKMNGLGASYGHGSKVWTPGTDDPIQCSADDYMAALKPEVAAARNDVWRNKTGMVEISGGYRAELLKTFTEQDINRGLECGDFGQIQNPLTLRDKVRRACGYQKRDREDRQDTINQKAKREQRQGQKERTL